MMRGFVNATYARTVEKRLADDGRPDARTARSRAVVETPLRPVDTGATGVCVTGSG